VHGKHGDMSKGFLEAKKVWKRRALFLGKRENSVHLTKADFYFSM
jgi:hypothetical protein